MRNLWPSFSRLALALSLVVGCAPLPQYPVSSAWPNKDVLCLRVYVDSPLDATTYRQIARREARECLDARSEREIPVYEIRCEFLSQPSQNDGSRRLAVVRLFPISSEATERWRPETVVY